MIARELGIESSTTSDAKLNLALGSIEKLSKWHGFPQSWNTIISLEPDLYDSCVSTVDLGNFVAGLILMRQLAPQLKTRVDLLINAMDWEWLFDKKVSLPFGCRRTDTTWHYDWLAADSRLMHFIGIGTGKFPSISWGNLRRDYDTSKCYDQEHFQPGWYGGGLFMAFLPGIFLNECTNCAIGISARNFVKDQICYAQSIQSPAWGWSATAVGQFGESYCGYGYSAQCSTFTVKDNNIVPHASILAANVVGEDTLYRNLIILDSIGARPSLYDEDTSLDFGFSASYNWKTKKASSVYLILDQSLAFLSLANNLTNGNIQKYFYQDTIIRQAYNLISDYVNCKPQSTAISRQKVEVPFSASAIFSCFRNHIAVVYSIEKPSIVELRIYSPIGKIIYSMRQNDKSIGVHHLDWAGILPNGQKAAIGIYYCILRLNSNAWVSSGILMLGK